MIELSAEREQTATRHSLSIDQLEAWLKVLAEPHRLQILALLMEGEQCNCELGERLKMKPNLISHHLSILRQVGLIKEERETEDRRWIYYSINREVYSQFFQSFCAAFNPDQIKASSAASGAVCRARSTSRRLGKIKD